MTANISIMFILGLATVCSHDFFKTFSNLYSYKDIFVQHEKSRVVTVLRENGFQLDLSFKNTSNVYRYNFVDSEMVCTQKNVVANSSILLLEEIEDTFSLESLPDNLKDLKDKIASTFFRFLKNDLKKIANKKTEKFGKTAKSRKKFFGYKIFNESDFSDRFTKKYVNDSTIVFATVVYRIDYSVDPVSIITFNGHSEKKVNGEIIRKRLLEKFKNVCAESAGIKICFFKSLWKDNKYYFFDDRISSTDFSISDRFSTLILKLHYLSLGSEVPRDFYFVCDEKAKSGKVVEENKGYFYMKTAAACVFQEKLENGHSSEFSENDPLIAANFVKFFSWNSRCDTFNSDMRFCFEGEFQGSVDDKIVVFGTFKNRSEWLLTKIGSNSDSSFLSAFMGRGDFCADSNEFYKTKMVFVCYDQLMFGRAFKILDVQFEGCSGVVTIGSSNLCKHPFFTPNTNYDEIICFHRSFADENVFGAAKELKKVEFVEY